jgi:GNAT superfamily N-acetyltransferase
MTDKVRIRPASADDVPAIASLLGQLGYPTSADRLRARMQRLAVDGPRARDALLVATDERGPDPVGVLALHRFAALHDDADVALIMALVVGEQARGLGVGRQLVDAAADTARRWGCTRMLVTTHLRRDDAHAFYERIGFEFTGRRYVKSL